MNIHQFINQKHIRISDKSKRFSHVSISPPNKYLIEQPYLDDFWTIYCAECHDKNLSLGEKPHAYMPIICDADIKLEIKDINDSSLLYTFDMILSLIKIYHSILFEIIDNLKEEDFICCVLEKEYYIVEKNKKYFKKNGFHLHFPRIFLSRYAQETELMPRIIQELKKIQISKTISFDKIIDTNYCKGAPWLLYGSSKGSDYLPYEISYCINSNFEKIHFRKALIDYNIYNENDQLLSFSENEIDFYSKGKLRQLIS
jgi:hypothetical protein